MRLQFSIFEMRAWAEESEAGVFLVMDCGLRIAEEVHAADNTGPGRSTTVLHLKNDFEF